MFYLLILLNISFASANFLATESNFAPSILGPWISGWFSRGVYFLLACLITLCFIVTTMKKKIEEKASQQQSDSEESWATAFWKRANPYLQSPSMNDELTDNKSDAKNSRMREANVTINSLKSELDIANKCTMDLENTIELYEKEKIGSQEELRRFKEDAAVEMEALKNEFDDTERKLQITLEEKEELSKEVECLKRERRINQTALKDQMILTERLEKARSKIEILKIRMKDLKAEKTLAVTLASEIIEKAKTDAPGENQLSIENLIEMSVKRVRGELDTIVNVESNDANLTRGKLNIEASLCCQK